MRIDAGTAHHTLRVGLETWICVLSASCLLIYQVRSLDVGDQGAPIDAQATITIHVAFARGAAQC